ncbi:MAG: hypothetical protein ABSA33_04030 [Candidatus Micrarchaeaceae archaeon]|jgi:hypothetical protein
MTPRRRLSRNEARLGLNRDPPIPEFGKATSTVNAKEMQITMKGSRKNPLALIAGASGFELCGGSSRMRPGQAALITN